MAIVGPQISQSHLLEGLVKFVVLAAELHFPCRIDIEKFAATQAFPGTRVIAAQHLLGVLAVKAHPGKKVMLG